MTKEKFIAATITTIILFLIVRLFTPDEIDSTPKSDTIEEAIEPVVQNYDSEAEEKVVLKKSVKNETKGIKTLKKNRLSKASKSANNTQPKNVFSKKTKSVYFKIKNGLALIGGDIVLGEVQTESESQKFEGKLSKKEPQRSLLWESSDIPFGFSEELSEHLKKEVLTAVSYINSETVMNFFEADPEIDKDVIVFKYRSKAPCSSYLGRVGGYQPIYLNNNCKAQDILHEIMHALGFVHEQQREERDEVLTVLWGNIQVNFKYNFAILPDSLVHQYSGSVFNINFNSIMMYPSTAFAVSGRESMRALNGQKISPKNNGLADIDKERLKLLYGY